MKKIQTTTFALILFTLTGCASGGFGYKKAGTTDQERAIDAYECRKEATYYGSNANVNAYGGSSSSGAKLDIEMAKACMRAKGYTIFYNRDEL